MLWRARPGTDPRFSADARVPIRLPIAGRAELLLAGKAHEQARRERSHARHKEIRDQRDERAQGECWK